MGVTLLCHELSLIFISTSSLLMDRILRLGRSDDDDSFFPLWNNHHEHCLVPACQLGIWLVLSFSIPRYSLEEDNEPFVLIEPWLHLTLATQLLRSTLTMVQSRRRRHRRWGPLLLFLLQWVSMAGWMTSVVVVVVMMAGARRGGTTNMDKDDHEMSLGRSCHVFLACMVILAVGRWLLECTATTMASPNEPNSSIINYSPTMTTTITTTALPLSSLPLDESQWYLWDTRQTRQWLEQRWTTRDDDDKTGDGNTIVQTLAPHRLCGDVLDSLTLAQLVHTLHVPYGPAVFLVRDIARLTQLYPKPPSPEEALGGRVMHPSWLELHDQEYYHREGKGGPPPHSNSSFPSRHDTTGTPPADDHDTRPGGPSPLPPIDPELEERLAALMKERYGIELPTLLRSSTTTRPGPHNDDHDNNDNHDKKMQSRYPSHLPAPPSLQDPSNHHALSPPAILLDNMPPRIREIAERRPDLVQALLLKQQQQEQQQRRRRPTPNQTIVVPEDEEEELEEDMDDETTSLVQRQPRRPSHKPTHGEMV